VEICSKKSTAVFSPHAKFSARRECPRFHGEPVEILIQKINCSFFAAPKVFSQKRVPKIPWRACGNFVPKNQLRLFRRTQSFPPEESAQDSMESMLKSKDGCVFILMKKNMRNKRRNIFKTTQEI